MPTKTNMRDGFTIVELLIVVVVVSILAVISLVTYIGFQERAKRTTIQSDMKNFSTKIELARADSTDSLYPAVPTTSNDIHATKGSYAVNRNNWYYCVSTDRTRYAIGVVFTGASGYIQSSTSGLEASTNVADSTTCAKASGISGTSQLGYSWNGTVGTWASWVQN